MKPLAHQVGRAQTARSRGTCDMRIEYLYRYPVKGLTAEALESAEVEAGGCIPWDRAFALAQGDFGVRPGRPRPGCRRPNFMCLMKQCPHRALFCLVRTRAPGMLAIRAPGRRRRWWRTRLTAAGRERIGAFLTDYLGEEARGTPALPLRSRPQSSATSGPRWSA